MQSRKPLEGEGRVLNGDQQVAVVTYYLLETPTRRSVANFDEPRASIPTSSIWTARITVLEGRLPNSTLTLQLANKSRVNFIVDQPLSGNNYSVKLTGPILPGS